MSKNAVGGRDDVAAPERGGGFANHSTDSALGWIGFDGQLNTAPSFTPGFTRLCADPYVSRLLPADHARFVVTHRDFWRRRKKAHLNYQKYGGILSPLITSFSA